MCYTKCITGYERRERECQDEAKWILSYFSVCNGAFLEHFFSLHLGYKWTVAHTSLTFSPDDQRVFHELLQQEMDHKSWVREGQLTTCAAVQKNRKKTARRKRGRKREADSPRVVLITLIMTTMTGEKLQSNALTCLSLSLSPPLFLFLLLLSLLLPSSLDSIVQLDEITCIKWNTRQWLVQLSSSLSLSHSLPCSLTWPPFMGNIARTHIRIH